MNIVVFYRILTTHHVVTAYMVILEEMLVKLVQRYVATKRILCSLILSNGIVYYTI